jgi:hypothetical protein
MELETRSQVLANFYYFWQLTTDETLKAQNACFFVPEGLQLGGLIFSSEPEILNHSKSF